MVITIPLELRSLSQWVAWKYEDRDGKKTKVPIDAKTGYHASVTNPETYSDFPTTFNSICRHPGYGLGFVFTKTDPYCGIDLDKCISSSGINPEAKEIITTLNSYTEISPSKSGIHVICKGKLPDGDRKNGHIEMYDWGRFFCMTGQVYNHQLLPIEERTEALAKIWAKYIAKGHHDALVKEFEQAFTLLEGHRHDAILRISMRCAGAGVPRSVTTDICAKVAEAAGFGPERMIEVERAIEGAYEKASAKDGVYYSERQAKILDVGKVQLWTAPSIEWLIPGLIPKNRIILGAGASQTGKSLFWGYAGLALSLGRDFAAFTGIKRGRVVYCVLEDDIATIRSRIQEFSIDFGELPEEGFYQIVFDYNFNLKTEIGKMASWIKRSDIDLLVIDTYQKATSGIGSKDEEVHSHLFHSMARIVRDSKCSILIVDHIRKEMTGKPRESLRLDDVLGSGKKVQNSDTVILMDRWDDILTVNVHSKDLAGDKKYKLRIGSHPKYRVLTYD